MLKIELTDIMKIMPSRNILRREASNSHYHVYARGASRLPIFKDEKDKQKFLSLFARYLSSKQAINKTGYVYRNLHDKVKLEAFCLMDNHFHLLLHQRQVGDISLFMRSLMTSYSRYFNLRHKRTGSLFESRYKSNLIDDDAYFSHISRYIHLNRRAWKYYKYSSVQYYRRTGAPDWFDNSAILDQFSSREEYIKFLEDYEDNMVMLDEIKHDLANY